MRYALKNKKKIVKAYQLGAGTDMEKMLIEEGAIKHKEDGTYELFSQEAVNGAGEVACSGDYFKVDEVNGKHFPYPNGREWFEDNHTHLSGDEYEQVNKPLAIWEAYDPLCEEIEYLVENGKLTIKEKDEEHYFNAFLWGAELSAAKNAVVLFYSVDKDDKGNITDISFNFVARAEFDKTYSYC